MYTCVHVYIRQWMEFQKLFLEISGKLVDLVANIYYEYMYIASTYLRTGTASKAALFSYVCVWSLAPWKSELLVLRVVT